MKVYYFNPNTYGSEFIVMAKSKESAFNSVVKHLFDYWQKPENIKFGFNRDEYMRWALASVENLPEIYSIEEYDENQVIETEIS